MNSIVQTFQYSFCIRHRSFSGVTHCNLPVVLEQTWGKTRTSRSHPAAAAKLDPDQEQTNNHQSRASAKRHTDDVGQFQRAKRMETNGTVGTASERK